MLFYVLVFRYCDANRKKIELIENYKHLPYSNYFISMICSEILLEKLKIEIKDLTHINFSNVNIYWDDHKSDIYSLAIKKIDKELLKLFPDGIDEIDPRRLAATFRRGDLLAKLENE